MPPSALADPAVLSQDDIRNFHEQGFLIVRVMQKAGVQNQIMVVRDGQQAIEYLEGQLQYADREKFPSPEILFVDLKMPRIEGWAVLAHLKRQPRFKDMLVIVLTDLKNPKELQQAYAMGAHSFLSKPLTLLDVSELIRQLPHFWVLHTPAGEKPRAAAQP